MEKKKKTQTKAGLENKKQEMCCICDCAKWNEQRSQRQSLAFHLHMTNFCFSFDFSFGRAPYVGSPLLFLSQVKLYVNARHRTFHIMLYTAKKNKNGNNGKKNSREWDYHKVRFFSTEHRNAGHATTCRVKREHCDQKNGSELTQAPAEYSPTDLAVHYLQTEHSTLSSTQSYTNSTGLAPPHTPLGTVSTGRNVSFWQNVKLGKQTLWNSPEYNKRCRCINVPNKYFFTKVFCSHNMD